MKLSDLKGPDADGWSDVAVFVRSDGSESEPFVVGTPGRSFVGIDYVDSRSVGKVGDTVRRLGRGRLVSERIEMQGETGLAEQVARLKEEVQRLQKREVSCVWCGLQFESTLQYQAQHLYQHAQECEKHPVRKLETQVQTLRVACRKADVLLTSFAVARNFSEHQKDAAVEVLVKVVAALAATAPMPTEDRQ